MWQKIYIKQYERGLMFRRGDFVRPLGPGTYVIPFWAIVRDRIEVVSTLKTKFEHQPHIIKRFFTHPDTAYAAATT